MGGRKSVELSHINYTEILKQCLAAVRLTMMMNDFDDDDDRPYEIKIKICGIVSYQLH